MSRQPYAIRDILVREDGAVPLVKRISDLHKECGISLAFANFIAENGICTRCHRPTSILEEHIDCAKSDFGGAYIEPLIPQAVERQFAKLWAQHAANVKSFVRRTRIQTAGGSHTRAQLRKLLAYQEHRCYYCFAEFARRGSRPDVHVDHFVALKDGGTDDIENLVYACPSCNREKGTSNGKSFRSSKLRKALPATRVKLRRIQRAVGNGLF